MQETITYRPPYWGFWATLAFGLVIGIVWMTSQGAVLFLMSLLYGLDWRDVELINGDVLAIATIVSAVITILATFIFVWLHKKARLRDYLGFLPISMRTIVIVLAVTVLFMITQEVLSRLLDKNIVPEFMLDAYKTITWLPLLWFAISVAGPVVEEIFFRGFLLQGLRHTFMGDSGAVTLTALLWAVIHVQYGWYEISIIFAMGIVFGYARILTNSIWSPIIMHMVNNFTSTVMLHWYVTSELVQA